MYIIILEFDPYFAAMIPEALNLSPCFFVRSMVTHSSLVAILYVVRI